LPPFSLFPLPFSSLAGPASPEGPFSLDSLEEDEADNEDSEADFSADVEELLAEDAALAEPPEDEAAAAALAESPEDEAVEAALAESPEDEAVEAALDEVDFSDSEDDCFVSLSEELLDAAEALD